MNMFARRFSRIQRRSFGHCRGGELGSFKDLENLTLDRLRDVKPNR